MLNTKLISNHLKSFIFAVDTRTLVNTMCYQRNRLKKKQKNKKKQLYIYNMYIVQYSRCPYIYIWTATNAGFV